MITYEHFYFLDEAGYPRHHIDTLLDKVVIAHSGDEIPTGATLITEEEAADTLVAYNAADDAFLDAAVAARSQLIADSLVAEQSAIDTALIDLAAAGVIEPTLSLLAASAGDIARRQVMGEI